MLDSIPLFPRMADLDIQHKPVLDALLHDLQPQTSELTFTNLYIWRHPYGAKLTRMADDVLAILALRADPDDSFLLPLLGPGAGAGHVRQCLEFMAAEGHNARLWRIDRPQIERLGLKDGEFSIESDRDNWDYVYRTRDLIDLPEDRYADKVKHIRQFTRRFTDYEYRPLTPDLVEGCIFLQDLWCDEKHCDLYTNMRAEARAVKEVLLNFETLGVTGGCILVRNRVQAFSLGEMLNADTVVIHIEKASPDLHGAFQVINQQFLAHAWSHVPYVNREQDVGEPGLRQAKESYLPVRMVEKFTVRLA
ncbi:MAG: DUF2156 domain-containing protein [Armatimonadetes bacterium]|nr:DUF2156 domain-containing protein [Armatimonadota bacterium]